MPTTPTPTHAPPPGPLHFADGHHNDAPAPPAMTPLRAIERALREQFPLAGHDGIGASARHSGCAPARYGCLLPGAKGYDPPPAGPSRAPSSPRSAALRHRRATASS